METYLTIMETEGERLCNSDYATPKMVKFNILRGLNGFEEYRPLVAQLERQIHTNPNFTLEALKAELMQAESQHRNPASERY
jgi:hypothetical protein